MTACHLLAIARDALAAIKPRTLDEVTTAIWDRAYATMQTSAASSVPQSERAETTAERPTPGHSPASGVAGAGHPDGALVAEVCRAHRADCCLECDEDDDALWVNPADLPTPHKECQLCDQLVTTRVWNIQQHQRSINLLNNEIAEIQHGMRHTAYHEALK